MLYPASRDKESIIVLEAPYGSDLYRSTVNIRRLVLRLPLGIDFTPQDLSDDKTNHHFVAIVNHCEAGALVLVPEEDGWGKIRQVAVLPEYQGTGVGTALMHAAHDCARRLGRSSVHLHARISAVEFYRKLGYLERGETFQEVAIMHQDMWIPL
jgi:GNAT superfamily N-acetyltransferase